MITVNTGAFNASGGNVGAPSAGQTFTVVGAVTLNGFEWVGPNDPNLPTGPVSYRIKVYRGAFNDQSKQQLFSQDVDFTSNVNASVAYNPNYGYVYSYSFSSLQLPQSGTYSIQFDYLGTWLGTSSVRFSSANAFTAGDGYGPIYTTLSLDSGAWYINGGGSDLLLNLTYTSVGGGSIPTEVASNPNSPATPTIPICFARGTRIQIGGQSELVESLMMGDQVSTTTASAAVKWLGYQRRTPGFAQFQDYMPVKISAGALDENVPIRGLYLSPDHAVLVDGHLIHAKALVNGKSIVQMIEWSGDIEYYHIETEAHEIIYAEGVPCETFIDNVSREQFDNYAEYQALYPNTRIMKELPLPRVKFRRQLPTMIKQRLESHITELDQQKKS
jgi:hypothetical protein